MITISDNAVSRGSRNNIVAGKLMLLYGVTQKTIQNWFEHKDPRLTTPDAVQIISEETGLDQEEILENGLESAKVS